MKGIDVFKTYFSDFSDQYVLIGGAACAILFQKENIEFRATKDLDIVLIAENLNREFGRQFWKFIRDGGYQNRAKASGASQFYRFSKPSEAGFPSMIELFARVDIKGNVPVRLTPVHIEDDVSSLSAILLDESYYRFMRQGSEIIDGISVLKPAWLVPFKAKAWLDLKQRVRNGEHVDSRNLKKHRNDIIRILAELILEPCELPAEIRADMKSFAEQSNIADEEISALKLYGIRTEDIYQLLTDLYL